MGWRDEISNRGPFMVSALPIEPMPIIGIGPVEKKMAENTTQDTLGLAALLQSLSKDSTLAAQLSAQGGGFGGNGMLPLLLLLFIGGRGRGLGGFGGDGDYAGGVTVKDALQQFQTWASTNSAQIAQQISTLGATLGQQICCAAHEVEEAVSGVNVSMLQAFANQATALNSGFAQAQLAASTNTAALQQTMSNHQALASLQLNTAQAQLHQQLTNNAAADALSACQIRNDIAATTSATQNQMAAGFAQASRERAECCCEIKSTVVQGTKEVLEKMAAIELDRVRTELSDAKTEISNLKQTVALEEALERRGGGHHSHA